LADPSIIVLNLVFISDLYVYSCLRSGVVTLDMSLIGKDGLLNIN